MTAKRTMQAKGAQARGSLKEAAGRATGNRRMQAEGHAEKSAGRSLDAAQKTKHTLRGH
ncbi:CsbD family protein [Streptomyces sp. NPDC048650]|uniref:CsbD family protein n=1 Tax=Streptomyces sp. NPDC048650 TaxID=3365583 RepID=UPI003718142F